MAILPGSSALQLVRTVRSEGQLRTAIQQISALGRPATILIAAPISLGSPIIIPGHTFTTTKPRGKCDGITIRSNGRIPITARGVVPCVFDVRARDVRIDGLYLPPPKTWVSGSSVEIDDDVFTDFVRMTSAANATGDSLDVVDCVAHIQRSGVLDDNSCSGRVLVDDCDFFQLKAPAAEEAVIKTNRDKFHITNNGLATFPSGGPFEGIRVDSENGLIALNEGDLATEVPSTIVLGATARGVILAGNTGFGTKTLGEGALDLDEDYSRQAVNDADLAAADLNFIGATTLVEYTALTASRTVDIPSPAALSRTKQRLIVKDGGGNASSTVKITLTTNGAATIDGAASYEITSAYGFVELAWNGTNWLIVSKSAAAAAASWTTVSKTATETRNTTTTFADDAELTFPVVAGGTYRFRIALHFATTTAPNFKFQLAGPATPTTVNWTATWPSSVAGANSDTRFFAAYATAAGVTDTAAGVVMIDGFVINGANAGNVRLQWAQSVLSGINTSILKGSYLEYSTVP
jgi:hypothetical protein